MTNENLPSNDVVAWLIEWPDGRRGRCPNDGPGARELVAARAMQGAKITEIKRPRVLAPLWSGDAPGSEVT